MSKELQIGDKAPDFTLESDVGQKVSLKDFRGKKVILYFYPRDDTPGCTKEACSFRDSLGSITSKDAVVLGVSSDGINSHKKFKQKYSLNFPLLSDPDKEVSKAYSVYKLKNLYGIKHWGIERSTFLIGEEGKISKIWRKVKVDGHKDEVVQAL
jgi:peroxiredoxin Q/BCP